MVRGVATRSVRKLFAGHRLHAKAATPLNQQSSDYSFLRTDTLCCAVGPNRQFASKTASVHTSNTVFASWSVELPVYSALMFILIQYYVVLCEQLVSSFCSIDQRPTDTGTLPIQARRTENWS